MKRQVPLGKILRINREKLELSIQKAAQKAQLKQEYVMALENGDYSHFKDDIYTRQYLKRYTDVIGISYDLAFDLYLYEFKHFQKEYRSHLKRQKDEAFRLIFPYKFFLRFLIMISCVIVFGYLGFRFYSISAAPELVIHSPNDHTIITEKQITIEGKTNPKARVIINERPILTDAQGNFTASIELNEGINDIVITSRKKHGKENSLIRHIIVESSQ